ncbi:DUF3097 domain-containing protein [Marisediminicola antarctica]|uniref:DUF3097 domain-containing protein n=1 Tax=Marisediminicola antarctica TaxID=674079 RepID=A0A7L5AKJ3_9MICO|nr:DUF3097 domain-containing protein [Marisediminicola antarctica]QHO70596.1 hypothetical protein BHD05_14000 [Marisediminicola antarctica]
MSDDRYSNDVLAGYAKRTPRQAARAVEAVRDLVIEESATGFCGAVLRIEGRLVHLEDYRGAVRVFPLGPGFLLEGEPVQLTLPSRAPTGTARSASGSFAVADVTARVARASRIFVEGRHDAELVEKVWGHDLRVEGVVVEYLEGVDDLEAIVASFSPRADRRIGVLVDHLVPGSKESRIADAVARGPHGSHVLVVGHPFVDIWQAVKPARVGLAAWPEIARSVEWKHGICEALGWPHEEQADIARAWQRILGRVSTFADLEPVLLGRVEQLIDFVTDDATDG